MGGCSARTGESDSALDPRGLPGSKGPGEGSQAMKSFRDRLLSPTARSGGFLIPRSPVRPRGVPPGDAVRWTPDSIDHGADSTLRPGRTSIVAPGASKLGGSTNASAVRNGEEVREPVR